MPPLVSVIIPCFNCACYLKQSVESVLSQTFTDLECLIIDDGSTDDTREVCKALMQNDSRVRYLLKEHGGLPAARNFGIRHAKGKWIQHLDSDDSLHKNKISYQLNYLTGFESEGDIVCYSDYEVIWENQNKEVTRTSYVIVGDLTNDQLLNRIMKWRFEPNIPLHVNNTLFKKSVFKNKMYNENFRAFQDLELFVDLLLKNVTFIYTPTVGMSYRIHHSNLHRDKARIVNAYIQFLEAVHKKNKKLLQLCPNMGSLIRTAIIERDKKMFNRLMKLVNLAQVPVYFSKRKININNQTVLRLAYHMRFHFPSDGEKMVLFRALFQCCKRLVRQTTHSVVKLINQR